MQRSSVDSEFDFLTQRQLNLLHRSAASLGSARIALRNCFEVFDSLSPFRQPPTRTYLFSGKSPTYVGQTGANAIDMLVNDAFKRGRAQIGLESMLSSWFKKTRMATGLKVKPLTSRHYEICLTGRGGHDHNLCDVGFGCSQVLPVLIGAANIQSYDSNDRLFRARKKFDPIFVVQEPEIHLHPNAQAELGTFLMKTFKNKGQVFIETHSPALIIRLQRHVALGNIAPEDLRVFLVSGSKAGPRIKVLRVNSEGFFENKWPGGFFPQRQEESLALAKAAYRKKNKNARYSIGGG